MENRRLHDSWCRTFLREEWKQGWNIHSLMQKQKWMKFCSCFQAVLRIEKKEMFRK